MAYTPGKMTLRKEFVWNDSFWTPDGLGADLALWLDADDASTITLNGSNVSQWRDKSGNDRHASQAAASEQPAYTVANQNGLNTLTFDGNSDSMALGADLSLGTSHSVFIAAKNAQTITPATASQMMLSGGAWVSPSTTTSSFFLGVGNLTGTLTDERLYSLVVANNGFDVAGVYGYGKTNADVSGGFFLSSAFTTDGNAFTGRLNGSNDFATATAGGGYSATNTRYPTVLRGIGNRFGGATSYWNGDIWEIVVLDSYASINTTQRIEGYLAWKWGLVANLPSGHPYKIKPPVK